MTKKGDWQERAARWFCIGAVLIAGFWLLRHGIGILLPFLIAYAVGALVYPLSVRTAKVLHLPQKLCAAIYVVLFLAAIGCLAFWGINHLTREAQNLLERLHDEGDSLSVAWQKTREALSDLPERFPFLKKFFGRGDGAATSSSTSDWLQSLLDKTLSGVGVKLSEMLGKALSGAPSLLFGLLVTVMACFYFSMDHRRLEERMLSFLPPTVSERVGRVRAHAGRAVRAYARAYLLLFLLTFLESLIGLWILHRPYAFLIALGVAVVDLLPVFGAGTVLIPWALLLFLGGDPHTALGLLILYGVMTIVRQIAEPRLIGNSLGLHPVVSLFAVFVGWKLFGFVGMLLGPAVALFIKESQRKEVDA